MAETPTLTVTVALADGGSTWEPGDLINITWALDEDTSSNEFPLWQTSRRLYVFLADSSGNKLNLKSRGITKSNGRIDHNLVNGVEPRSGTYLSAFPDNPVQWELPYNLDAGDYKIIVHRKEHSAQGGTSAAFTFTTEYDLNITAPTAADDDWERGTTESITWDQSGVDTVTEATLYYRLLGEKNSDWVEIADSILAGSTAAITAFADAGAGQVTVTSVAHGLSNGNTVVITGTTSYNGTFIIANKADDTYEITDTWVADDATGTWQLGYSWTIPVDLAPGLYQIGMLLDITGYDSEDDTYYAMSDAEDGFAIVDRTITIDTPILSEKILEDTSDYAITWTASSGYSSTDELTIYYQVDGGDWTVIAGGIAADDETYTWNLSSPSLDPGTYNIAIRDTNYDETDSQTESDAFRIVAKDVTITFPYAGALIHRGTGGTAESYKITWTYEGYEDADTITIWIQDAGGDWSGETELTSSPVALSTDEFTWSIDSDFTPGPYNMRIKRAGDTYPATDFIFSVSDSLSDFNRIQKITSLVAVQKSKVYYSEGSWMRKLTDYQSIDATINPSNHVAVFSAFQKVFVLDGNYREDPVFPGFRFVDFGNLRMTGTLQGTLVGGDVLVGTANGSVIIVDYMETVGATNVLYGQVISGGVIGVEEEFELDASNGFTVTVFTDPPHWVNWDSVVYSGSLPESCNIGCAWNGRLVTAGNSARPHQWYMSRAGDPFDHLYAAGDARSPMAGGDSNVSEVGDGITGLIPYNADTLLMGAYNSIEIMRGDPAAGGSLSSFYHADGLFGPQSWCIDNNNICYWVGNYGLYRAAVGSSYPIPVSHSRIPKFLDGISRNTHWITLVFDGDRNGVLIFITNSDITAKPEDGEAYGDMQVYWYDIATGGLFPESYPASSGVFSALNYQPEVPPSWYQPVP